MRLDEQNTVIRVVHRRVLVLPPTSAATAPAQPIRPSSRLVHLRPGSLPLPARRNLAVPRR